MLLLSLVADVSVFLLQGHEKIIFFDHLSGDFCALVTSCAVSKQPAWVLSVTNGPRLPED